MFPSFKPYMFIILFVYFWLCWVFTAVQAFLQLWQAQASLHCGDRLLIVVACLVAEHSLQSVWTQQLWLTGSRVRAPELWFRAWPSLAASWHVASFQTKDQTRVSCTGRWIPSPWTTRAVQRYYFLTCARSVAHLSLTLWNSMDCSLPGSYVLGNSHARMLEWVPISGEP